MAAVLLYWMVKTEGDWGRQWLSMLIASVIAYWVLRSVLLRLFPLEFPQEILGATPESQEPIATHAVNRAVPAAREVAVALLADHCGLRRQVADLPEKAPRGGNRHLDVSSS